MSEEKNDEFLDCLLKNCKITVDITPTANTPIETWVYASPEDGPVYPDEEPTP